MQITAIILFRLILYDEPVYEDVSGSVTAYGYIESIKERDTGITVTAYNVTVTEGPKVSKRDKLLVYYSSSDNLVNELKIGQLLKITGDAKPIDTPSNPGEFNASGYYHNKGYAYSIFSEQIDIVNYRYNRMKEAIRTISDRVSAIYYKMLPENEAGLTCGIVLGKRELISEEDEALYRKNGIMHLLAVSGVKTLKLDIPLVPETRINWAFVPLHIAIIYILKLCLDEEIIPRCRFPCSRGYFTKCIN